MRAWSEVRERLRALLFRSREERELEEELALHLDLETEKNLRDGMDAPEARRQARVAFGGVGHVKEEVRRARGVRWLEDFAQDVRYALRGLRQDFGFALTTVVSLAVGVGAVTTAFGVVYAVDFRPLPYRAHHQLVVLGEVPRTGGGTCGWCRSSAPAVRLWRSETRLLRDIAVLELSGAHWYRGDRVERVLTADVSPNFFSVLGVPPMLGRTFTAEEATSGPERVIVVGHGFWRTQLGGDPAVVGRTLDLRTSQGHGLYTVVGVMPPSFRFLDNQAWLPLTLPANGAEPRYIAVGRMRPGVAAPDAAVEARTLFARLAAEAPSTHEASAAAVLPLRDWVHRALPDVGRARFLLFAIALFVLLVAALNTACLSVSRARGRLRDQSIRSALGATHSRLIRQFLTESVVLTGIGGALGIWITYVSADAVEQLSGLSVAGFNVDLDARVLGFSLLVTSLAGIGAGKLPAWYGAHGRTAATLVQRGGRGSSRGARLQAGLVALEIACSMLLLTAGGIAANELWRLRRGRGYNPDDLYLVQLGNPGLVDPGEQRARVRRGKSELLATPGVVDVASTGQPGPAVRVRLEGEPEPLPQETAPMVMVAGPALFATIGLGPLAGRLFSEADWFGSPQVAVVNETAAAALWAGTRHVGRRLVLSAAGRRQVVHVVGVVPDVRVFNAPLHGPMPPIIYRPIDQVPTAYPLFIVRARGAPREIVPALRRVAGRLMRGPVPPSAVVEVEAIQRTELSQERLHGISINAFGVLGLFLASVGVYGIMAYTTAQRRCEVAIRKALGASPPTVLLDLLRDGLGIAGLGLALGLIASRLMTRGFQALVTGTGGVEWWVVGRASAILTLVLGLSIFLPAHRAAKVEPGRVLGE